jgi:hypothetical protein
MIAATVLIVLLMMGAESTYDYIYSFNCTPDDGCRKHPKHVE